jgi:hypothetical protein
MVNKVLLLTGVILFGVVATIIAINYYYYHPIRPFYPPPPTSGKLDKFGIKEIYLSKHVGGEEWYLNTHESAKRPENRRRRTTNDVRATK